MFGQFKEGFNIVEIKRLASGLIGFYTTTGLDFTVKDTATLYLQRSTSGQAEYQYLYLKDGGYDYSFRVDQLTRIDFGFSSVSFTPIDENSNAQFADSYGQRVADVFEALSEFVFKSCCRPASPTVVGGLLVEEDNIGDLIASAPGSAGVLYLTRDDNQMYRWDGTDFVKVDGYLRYPDFASFPVAGLEGIFYYDEDEGEMYVWDNVGSLYKSLCCDAEQLIYKHNQTSHGFSVGDWIYADGDSSFALALADDIATSYVVGMVTNVVSANLFQYVTSGWVQQGVPSVTGGTIAYLSETVAGGVTTTPPTSPNIVRPLMMVLDDGNLGLIMLSLVDPGSGGSSTPPVDGSYADQAAMIAAQGSQIAQYIYFDGTDYWEYLGTTNGDITDYRQIGSGSGGAFWPLAGTNLGAPVTGDIEIDPTITQRIYQDDGAGVFSEIGFYQALAVILKTEQSSGDVSQLVINTLRAGLELYDNSESSGISVEVNGSADSSTYKYILSINNNRWNFNGQSAPTVNDDNSLGYDKDSGFIHDGTLYICQDPTTGAAVWVAQGGGSSLTLQTDGTPNGDQTLLNLAAGTNVTLTDNGLGTVTIDAASTGVQSVTGNIVDITDPDNPVVDQVQADWNQANSAAVDFIKNKPTIVSGILWVPVSTSLTAANKTFYVNIASATYTDPTGADGEFFEVVVEAGTATVGGVGYSVRGTRIVRVFNSSVWTSYVYSPGGRMSKILSGDFSTTSDTFTDVTALEMTLEANKNYSFRFTGRAGCDNSNGSRFGFTLPAGAIMTGYTTARTTGPSAIINQGLNFPTSTESGLFANQTGGTTVAGCSFEGVIIMGGTAGAVTPRWRSNVNTQESTLFAGFIFKIEEE